MKAIIFSLAVIASIACSAAPHFGRRPAPRPVYHQHGPRIVHHHAHHVHHHSPGPAFVGGLIGGLIGSATVQLAAPVAVVAAPSVQPVAVIQSPIAVPRQVWVEGRHVTEIINGVTTLRWIPGHWETVFQ